VDVTPDGTRAYIANNFSTAVSVIDIATTTVIATIPTSVGSAPFAFGKFIGAAAGPPPPPVTKSPFRLAEGSLWLQPMLVAFAATLNFERRKHRK
jgi:YVTN family beta-propeller protein